MTDSIRKVKLLKIWEILSRETNEDHPMSTQEIIKRLGAVGIPCDRRTLYSDIKTLNDFGYEILCNREASNKYFVMDRTFNISELQILIDAVQAASFITEKKTGELIDKIASLGGNQKADILKGNIVQFGTVKGNNESIYYSVSEITQAINNKKKISFNYFNYDVEHMRKYRMRKSNPTEKKLYVVNPVATVFHDDKYYLFCYNDYHGNIVQYRVDRMENVRMLDEDIIPNKEAPNFDLSKHQRSLVSMFGGKEESVTFECDSSVLDSIFDKFGEDVTIKAMDGDKLKLSVKVQLSKPFYSWVCGFGSKLKVVAPKSVVKDVTVHITEAYKNYVEDK